MFSFWKKTAAPTDGKQWPAPLQQFLESISHEALPLALTELAVIKLSGNRLQVELPFRRYGCNTGWLHS